MSNADAIAERVTSGHSAMPIAAWTRTLGDTVVGHRRRRRTRPEPSVDASLRRPASLRQMRRSVHSSWGPAPHVCATVGWVRSANDEALPLLLTLSSAATGAPRSTQFGAAGTHPAAVRVPADRHVGRAGCWPPSTRWSARASTSSSTSSDGGWFLVTEVAIVKDLQGGLEATRFTATEVRRPSDYQPLAWTATCRCGRRGCSPTLATTSVACLTTDGPEVREVATRATGLLVALCQGGRRRYPQRRSRWPSRTGPRTRR